MEKGLTELEVQPKYFKKLNKELKCDDRYHLMGVYKKLQKIQK